MKKEEKKMLVQITLIVFASILVLIGLGSFAFFYFNATGTNEYGITTGSFSVSFEGQSNEILIDDSLPMQETIALGTLTPYKFTVHNNAGVAATYNLKLVNSCFTGCNCTASYLMDASVIRYRLVNKTSNLVYTGTNPSQNLFSSVRSLAANSTDTYTLFLWIDAATDEDSLYVKDGSNFVLTTDGLYTSKNYCAAISLTATQS